MIGNLIDRFGDWLAKTFPSDSKDSGVVKFILAIVLIFVFCASVIFGILSWVIGIGFLWFWLALFLTYVLYCLWLYIKMNSIHKGK